MKITSDEVKAEDRQRTESADEGEVEQQVDRGITPEKNDTDNTFIHTKLYSEEHSAIEHKQPSAVSKKKGGK